jgi:membrane protease YdiL (CAAX protease family)
MRRHPVISHFVLAYSFSWAVWVPMALAGARVSLGQAWPTHIAGLFGPITAAFIMVAVVNGPRGIWSLCRRMSRWRTAVGWYLVAVSPIALYGGAVAAVAALGQDWPDPAKLGMFSGLPAVAVPMMALLLLVASYAEETGWRGFAADELLKTRSMLWTAVVIGLLWACWHVPSFFVIDNYREMGLAIVPMFGLGVVSGSILLAWLYRGSGGSVLLVALWHTGYNLVSGTAGASGVPAAVVWTAIVLSAAVMVVAEATASPRAGAALDADGGRQLSPDGGAVVGGKLQHVPPVRRTVRPVFEKSPRGEPPS